MHYVGPTGTRQLTEPATPAQQRPRTKFAYRPLSPTGGGERVRVDEEWHSIRQAWHSRSPAVQRLSMIDADEKGRNA